MKKIPTFAVFLLFGREATAGVVKPDLFLSENQSKNPHNILHPHSSLTFILVHHRTKGLQEERIEIKN